MRPLHFLLIFVIVLLWSCGDDDGIPIGDAADAIERGIFPAAIFDKQDQTLYAYSTVSLSIPNISKVLNNMNISYRVDIDEITATIDGSPIQVKYEIKQDDFLNIYPDEYYSKSGKLSLNIQFRWRYWDKIDKPYSSNISEWKVYKQETSSIEYTVFARIAPQNVFESTNSQSINTHIYYVPQTKVSYLPDNIVEEQYKYEIESRLDDFSLSPYVEENNMVIYYDYEGQLQSQKNYTFTAKAKWYRLVNNSWIKCADIFDENYTQDFITSNPAGTVWEEEDIDFSYPLYRQFNFLPDEYDKGYVKLSKELTRQYSLRLPFAEFNEVGSQLIRRQAEVSYNKNLKILEFDLPQNYFEPEKIYKISFKDQTTDAIIYSYYFKTSKFNNFTEKWESLRNSFKEKWRNAVSREDDGLILTHTQKINMQELEEVVDGYETAYANFRSPSSLKIHPLIQFDSHVLESWKNTINWYIYSQPSLPLHRKSDPMNAYSFPPTDAICFYFNTPRPALSDDSCLTGIIDYYPHENEGTFHWMVKSTSDLDVLYAIERAQNIPENQRNDVQKKLAQYPYYGFEEGDNLNLPRLQIDMALGGDSYPLLDVYYVLPGLGIKTTTIKDVQL